MRIYRYFSVAISGIIDITELTRKVGEMYPEVQTASVKLNQHIEGVQLSGLSQGVLLQNEDEDSEVEFHLNAFAFPSGIVMFEICFEPEEYSDRFTSLNLLSEKIVIVADGERSEESLLRYSWMFFFRIMQYADILPRMKDINILDENAQMEIHKAIRDTSMLETYFLGNDVHLLLEPRLDVSSIICGEQSGPPGASDAEHITVIRGKVIKSDNVYYCSIEEQDFLEFYRVLVYRRSLTDLYMSILIKWMEKIKIEAKLIKKNLNEKNRIYWNKLKNRIEVWDLNYLDFYTTTVSMLHQVEEISIQGLVDECAEEYRVDFNRRKASLHLNMEHVKYALSNIATPGEVHDEQILQQATEKGNERIMLLSFLAMSIPLLGALLAPGISVMTKITAALILFLMPVIYFYIRKYHHRRDHRRSNRLYFLNMRQAHVADISKARSQINFIETDSERNAESKEEILVLLRESLSFAEKQLNDIDQEIERL
ncbi:MAG: hypothetical protein KAR44_09500 [Candidatus Aegiribacteria sp.]|nr:hypothetical protein [Candidatus Aegiribacteria sp.]